MFVAVVILLFRIVDTACCLRSPGPPCFPGTWADLQDLISQPPVPCVLLKDFRARRSLWGRRDEEKWSAIEAVTLKGGDTLSSRHVSSHKTYVLFSTPSLSLPMRWLSNADLYNLVTWCHKKVRWRTVSISISSISGNNW
jgi:hypothetical protein